MLSDIEGGVSRVGLADHSRHCCRLLSVAIRAWVLSFMVVPLSNLGVDKRHVMLLRQAGWVALCR